MFRTVELLSLGERQPTLRQGDGALIYNAILATAQSRAVFILLKSGVVVDVAAGRKWQKWMSDPAYLMIGVYDVDAKLRDIEADVKAARDEVGVR